MSGTGIGRRGIADCTCDSCRPHYWLRTLLLVAPYATSVPHSATAQREANPSGSAIHYISTGYSVASA
eukprot:847348-Rhodomonas_salina.1